MTRINVSLIFFSLKYHNSVSSEHFQLMWIMLVEGNEFIIFYYFIIFLIITWFRVLWILGGRVNLKKNFKGKTCFCTVMRMFNSSTFWLILKGMCLSPLFCLWKMVFLFGWCDFTTHSIHRCKGTLGDTDVVTWFCLFSQGYSWINGSNQEWWHLFIEFN